MNQILKLKENIIYFLSPPSKRRRTLPATPIKDDKHNFLTPQPAIIGRTQQSGTFFQTNQPQPYSSEFRTSRKRRREDDSDDGFTETGVSGVSPDDSISQMEADEESSSSAASAVGREVSEEAEEELAEEEVSGDAKVEEYLARQAELAVRMGDIEKARAIDNLHPDALFLTERIHMRSFEEILPMRWKIDFQRYQSTCSLEVPEKQFINSNDLSNSAGVRALQSLLALGERVQAVLQNDGPTERCIAREVKSYIKWSERDGGFYNRRFLPVIVVVTARPGQSTKRLGDNLLNQLAFLAQKHRDYLDSIDSKDRPKRPPPLLYGILIVQTLVILFTYDSARSNPDLLKTVVFDLKGDRSQAVWDCFGIAFLIICARNYVMSIKDEFEEEEEETDPDL